MTPTSEQALLARSPGEPPEPSKEPTDTRDKHDGQGRPTDLVAVPSPATHRAEAAVHVRSPKR
jgi:hypothetical protein